MRVVLHELGHIQPTEIDEMDSHLAQELARRLSKRKHEDMEMWMKFMSEMTKAIIKSNGARVF